MFSKGKFFFKGWDFVLEVWGGIKSFYYISVDNNEIFKIVGFSSGRERG